MDLIPVEGSSNLYRDPRTNAIVNNNEAEYDKYIKQRQIRKSRENKIDTIESDLSQLKNEINEIKSLLQALVSK